MKTVNLIWHDEKTEARGWSVKATDKMPDYISLSFGSISHHTGFCITPASAKQLALMIWELATELDHHPDLISFTLEKAEP